MIDRLFPRSIDSGYQGHWLAKWLLGLFVFRSLVAGSIHMFASDGGAASIASITLDDFTQSGADSLVTIFGLWGLEQFVIGLIGAVMLWRYPALIPMMALAYVIEYIGRFAAPLFTPGVVTEHEPPGVAIDKVFGPLALIMLGLSLWGPKASARLQRDTVN